VESGEDWLYRPLLRGLFKAESLYDGSLDLLAVAKLNEVLDVQAENEYRMRSQ
jgi:hypothetical protein